MCILFVTNPALAAKWNKPLLFIVSLLFWTAFVTITWTISYDQPVFYIAIYLHHHFIIKELRLCVVHKITFQPTMDTFRWVSSGIADILLVILIRGHILGRIAYTQDYSVVCLSVCLSVCLLVTYVSCNLQKMAEPIWMTFWGLTRGCRETVC